MREVIKPKRPEVALTLADRIVSWWDPLRGMERLRARTMMAVAGGYVGASTGKRSLSKWRPRGNSADADILPDLPELRARAADLSRNSAIACGALNTVVTKTVGTGLALQSAVRRDILGWDEARASDWQRRTQTLFNAWAESTACDVTRAQNFYQLQGLAFRSALERGDAFVLRTHAPRPDSIYALALQLIEADRVANPGTQGDTPALAGGVEMDAQGAPLAYHILKQHPGALGISSRESMRVPAFGARSGLRNVLHLMDRRRIGQTRGVPYLAPVIEPLKQLDRYTEAEITAAVVSGLFAVFITSESGDVSPLESAVTGETPGGADGDRSGAWDGTLTPGLAVGLAPNEKVEATNPGRPNTVFDPFVQAILRQIGVALELPFEVLIKHFTASYTAARAALLEAWQFIRGRRDMLATTFCQPVYEWWLAEAVARGIVDAPGYLDDPLLRWAYASAEWVGDGPGSVDPVKEVAAAKERIDLGISTRASESLLHDGVDWESKHEQLAREARRRREDGLDGAPAAPPEHPGRNDRKDMNQA